jgi:hypothetical protein
MVDIAKLVWKDVKDMAASGLALLNNVATAGPKCS